VFEVGEHVRGPLLEGPPQPSQLGQRGRHVVAQVVDGGPHELAASGAVGVAVGADHPLIDPPGGLDVDVFLDREQRVQPGGLLLGEQALTGMQGPPSPVQRVVGAALANRCAATSTTTPALASDAPESVMCGCQPDPSCCTSWKRTSACFTVRLTSRPGPAVTRPHDAQPCPGCVYLDQLAHSLTPAPGANAGPSPRFYEAVEVLWGGQPVA